MRAVGGLLIVLGLASASSAVAGTWSLPKGQGQVIVKYEDMQADEGFGPNGGRVDLPAERLDRSVSAFVEYGLTDRVTLQFKGEWQQGRDAYVDFDGSGPVEIGARWQAYRDDHTAAAVYVGYAQGGAARNAGYASPGAGDSDWEARALVARSLDGGGRAWAPQRSFVEAQVARRWRQGLPDEVRVDLTAGAHLSANWMLLGQAFGGATDGESARWLSVEGSAVRRFGDWSVQAGWRQAMAGRETVVSGGPVIGLWRQF